MWFWLLTLIVLAVVAYFLIRAMGARAGQGTVDDGRAGDATPPPDPLEHDRDGLNRPLPGQRAATDGEVHDAAREHVGAHLEHEPGGRPAGGDVARDGTREVGGSSGGGADGGVSEEMAARVAGSGAQADGEVGAAATAHASGHGATPESDATLPDGDGDGRTRTAPLEGTSDSGTLAYGERDTAARASDADRSGGGDGGETGAGGAGSSAASAPAASAPDGADEVHRVGASVRTQPEADSPARGGGSPDMPSVGATSGDPSLTSPGSPDPADHGHERIDAETAARAARESRDEGGTGAAVLAGIATAAGAGTAAAVGAAAAASRGDADAEPIGEPSGGASEDERSRGDDTDRDAAARGHDDGARGEDDAGTGPGITNPPDPETAGSLELEGRTTDSAAALRGDEATRGRADTAGEAERVVTDAAPGETASGQSIRDNARTNAPVNTADPGESARDRVDVPAANVAAADAPVDELSDEQRANQPIADTAGAAEHRDRAAQTRSNVVAGTATLAVGGATSSDGEAQRLPNGGADLDAPGAIESDAARLEGGERRANVREMMKILNLHESDASRLGISKDDFSRLWQAEGGADDRLVDEVSERLRRLIG